MIVVVAVTEKQVVINNAFNPTPVTGRNAIFARVNAPTELKPEIELVGAYTTLEKAEAARVAHHSSHPQCRYVQKVCTLDDVIPQAELPKPPTCIMCGVETNGLSYCAPCNDARMKALRESDPELMKQIAGAT